jgi:protein-tyrosine phosphatase
MSDLATPYVRSYWVDPGKLLAGCYPGDKNPEKAAQKLDGLVAAGIRHVVNLMEAGEIGHLGELFVPYDAPFNARGISCVRMPIEDFHAPRADAMVPILDEIDQSIAAGAPTYVHCWGGRGRTGTVVGCWLIRHGLASPGGALDRIQELQANCEGQLAPSPENEVQRMFVRNWTPGQ